ncbi:MAG: hypothetical protein EXQ81_02155 [Thermoleophilia bacterium]|nr:hypothetical protein [Thermoleophilia bacterium]
MSDPDARTPRSFRERPLGRIAIFAVVLIAAFAASRSCADTSPDFSKDEALASARAIAAFEPGHVQIRFIRSGVPPRGYWAVSMYQGEATAPTRTQLVLIDANTGTVTDDGR